MLRRRDVLAEVEQRGIQCLEVAQQRSLPSPSLLHSDTLIADRFPEQRGLQIYAAATGDARIMSVGQCRLDAADQGRGALDSPSISTDDDLLDARDRPSVRVVGESDDLAVLLNSDQAAFVATVHLSLIQAEREETDSLLIGSSQAVNRLKVCHARQTDHSIVTSRNVIAWRVHWSSGSPGTGPLISRNWLSVITISMGVGRPGPAALIPRWRLLVQGTSCLFNIPPPRPLGHRASGFDCR